MARLTPDADRLLTRILQVTARVTGNGSRAARPLEDVSPDTALVDAGVTSYLLFRFIRELEAEFRIRFRDDDLDYSLFETIGQVTRLVGDYRRSDTRPG